MPELRQEPELWGPLASGSVVLDAWREARLWELRVLVSREPAQRELRVSREPEEQGGVVVEVRLPPREPRDVGALEPRDAAEWAVLEA